ncbi:DUF3857 domain-containing protein [Edaphobacter acidisoli]|nr:DUF3857 domain-containing protein [Edaphobacter acidisoli]
MNRMIGHRCLTLITFVLLFSTALPFASADEWTTPTHEELTMTSEPEVPGASAIYLNYEEIASDDMHDFSVYARIKVLTDAGKERGDVELQYASWREGASFTIGEIRGRTIHSDGTIIPFSGKPYQKLIVKSNGLKVMAKVFTMPDVQTGSIIEYRYNIRYDDEYVVPPSWYIQTDLFTRKAHYVWKPTTRDIQNDRGMISTIAWFPILPEGAKLDHRELPATTLNGPQQVFELSVDNVPPAPHEDFMPPIGSLTYRVLFYYSNFRNGDEFWAKEGKTWSKNIDKFVGPGHGVTAQVQQLVSVADTPDQKLRKIYAFVMQLENTSYTREQAAQEDRAHGLKEVHDTDDILALKHGNDDQLAELFVAMARAAGMKAYVAAVTNRDKNIFIKQFLAFTQLDDYIAIVNVDGKDEYFDPGARYCPYQHLEWKHTMAGGIRQADGGIAFIETPPEPYKNSRTERIADLTMDEHGVVTGIIKMTYVGAPALTWRHRSLTGDSTSLEREFQTSMEHLVPQGMDVKVISIDKLMDYEEPLTVNFEVRGPIGEPTGKRIFVPSDIFMANAKPVFTDPKRDIPVYFDYPHITQDAVRIKYPSTFSVESYPSADQYQFASYAIYNVSSQPAANSITFHRNFYLGEFIFFVKDYPGLRDFYSKMTNKDQENIVLTTASSSAKPAVAAN